MKILIPTIGSRGDVQPFIALAQGLSHRGHIVTLASHPVMRALVETHGVSFSPIGPDINLEQEVADIRSRSKNVMLGLINGMRFGFSMVEQAHADILRLCRGTDLMVIPGSSACGRNEADQLLIPHLSVNLMPWSIPWTDPERPLFKRLAYAGIDKLVSLITTQPLNRMRKRQGLSPVGPEGLNSPRLNLIPVSPLVYTPNPRWEPQHRLVGYWFAEKPEGWQPPADLLAFLNAGDPPLVISLGAMSLGSAEATETASLFLDAVRAAGLRAVIQGWGGVFTQMKLPESIFTTGSLPHSWLLPHSAGVVHHGGFGTTSACLWAGVPALVIPHMADQFYWGQIVHQMGAGSQPIRRTRLEREGLTAALHELRHNVRLHEVASALGEKIRLERGVENAIRLIEAEFTS